MDWIDDQNEKAEQDFWEAEAIFSEQKREFLEQDKDFCRRERICREGGRKDQKINRKGNQEAGVVIL